MNGSLVRRAAAVALLGVMAVALTGCFAFRRVETTTPLVETETKTIPKAGVSELDARIKMPIGMLNVDGKTTWLAEMTFESSNADWMPIVSSSESEGASGTVSSVVVAVPEGIHARLRRNNRYEWNIHIAPDVQSRLSFELGAGESTIDLRGVGVRDLAVTTGVGETVLDVSGPRTDDLDADVKCGIGEVTIRVPKDVGVRVSGRQEGIGDLTADGFTMSGDELTNAAWATSPTKIEIALQRGIGEVRIETVD